MFKVQCNEKDIIHIHAFGNGDILENTDAIDALNVGQQAFLIIVTKRGRGNTHHLSNLRDGV